MSEQFQRNGESVIGQKARKTRLLGGLDQCQLEQGKHMKKFFTEVLCVVESSIQPQVEPMWQTCHDLASYERASKVKWNNIELTEGKSKWKPIENPVLENINLQQEIEVDNERTSTVPMSYAPLSSYLEDYTKTIREKIEFYLGDDKLMKVAKSLDQVEWPTDLNEIKNSPQLMEGFRLWPEIFKYDEITPEIMNEEVNELIRQLTDPESQIKWCDIWQSDPTSFWSLLLTDGNLSQNMIKLVESTLAMPYGSAQAERFFSIMNLIKHKRRAMLSPDTLDKLMRIKLSDDSLKTLNVNRLTTKYLLHHQKCDKGWSREKKLEEYHTIDDELDEPFGFEADRSEIIRDILGEESSSSDSESSSSGSDTSSTCSETTSGSDDDDSSDEGQNENQVTACSRWAAECVAMDHSYFFDVNKDRLLDKLPQEVFITFRNMLGSKVLSVHGGQIVVKAFNRHDNSQKWFVRDKHIVAYSGKVLQVTEENRPVELAFYDPGQVKQRWRIQRTGERSQLILSSFQNLRMDLINKNAFASMHSVGATRRGHFRKDSQRWLGIISIEQDQQDQQDQLDEEDEEDD